MNELLKLLNESNIEKVKQDATEELNSSNSTTNGSNDTNTIKTYGGANKEIFLQEGINYDSANKELIDDANYKRNHINEYINNNAQKIPLITHQAYFTSSSPEKRKPMDALSIKKSTITTTRLNDAIRDERDELIKKVMSSDVSDEEKLQAIESIKKEMSFKHIIWTNNVDIIPEQLKNIEGVEVHLIDELSDKKLFKELNSTLEEAQTDKGKFAEASDIIRLMGVKEFGGIYHDLDYEVYNPAALIKLTKAFHFIGGKERPDEVTFVGNAFFAACKNHPVMNQAIDSTERNLNKDLYPDTPEYIRYPNNKFHKVIYETGPGLLSMSYFKAANQEGYNDVIMPWNVFFHAEYAWLTTPESRCHHHYDHNNPPSLFTDSNGETIETIGADMFCGDWGMNNNYHDPICYCC